MSLMDRLKQDKEALEKMNLEMHENYVQQGAIIVNEVADPKAFEKIPELEAAIKDAADHKDEILRRVAASQENNKYEERKEKAAENKSSSPWGSPYGSGGSSSNTYWNSSNNPSNLLRNAELRADAMLKKAHDYAVENGGHRYKRHKKGVFGKLFPKKSKRRKAALIASVLVVQGLIVSTSLVQWQARERIIANLKKISEGISK